VTVRIFVASTAPSGVDARSRPGAGATAAVRPPRPAPITAIRIDALRGKRV